MNILLTVICLSLFAVGVTAGTIAMIAIRNQDRSQKDGSESGKQPGNEDD